MTAPNVNESTHFSKAAFAQHRQKVEVFDVIFPESWNYCGRRCEFSGLLELGVSVRRLCSMNEIFY